MTTRPDHRRGTGREGRRITDLGDGTYRNPVLSGDFPDPAVLRDGAGYYLTTSWFDASPGAAETSGYHANTASDLLSLRPAPFAAGYGTVTFSDFRYRAVP